MSRFFDSSYKSWAKFQTVAGSLSFVFVSASIYLCCPIIFSIFFIIRSFFVHSPSSETNFDSLYYRRSKFVCFPSRGQPLPFCAIKPRVFFQINSFRSRHCREAAVSIERLQEFEFGRAPVCSLTGLFVPFQHPFPLSPDLRSFYLFEGETKSFSWFLSTSLSVFPQLPSPAASHLRKTTPTKIQSSSTNSTLRQRFV